MLVLSPSLAAASASMRPSCPPPRMPIVLPGGSGASGIILDRLGDGVGLGGAQGGDAVREARVGQRQDLRRKQAGIGGTGFADRQGADRYAGRHLRDGKKAIEALERAALDGNAEHREL